MLRQTYKIIAREVIKDFIYFPQFKEFMVFSRGVLI